ncbi:innexin-11-like [Tropilaelaps mercedesae]|uniref:Innexin-11-like n=1 Tax=Tropilaelaps mercedesae TaxID=418985 RepID=A0A1V9X212_9ACAR|nr:innexin-11-like [Tropilaelaps mercedesae]
MLASEMRPCVEKRSEPKTARGVFFRDTHRPSALSISLHLTQIWNKSSSYSEVAVHPPAGTPEFCPAVVDCHSNSTSNLDILLGNIDVPISSSAFTRDDFKSVQLSGLRGRPCAVPGSREGGRKSTAVLAHDRISKNRTNNNRRSTRRSNRTNKSVRKILPDRDSRRSSHHCHVGHKPGCRAEPKE